MNFRNGRLRLFCLAGGGDDRYSVVVLVVHSVMQHRVILRGVANSGRVRRVYVLRNSRRLHEYRRKNRLWIACAVLAGLALTTVWCYMRCARISISFIRRGRSLRQA